MFIIAKKVTIQSNAALLPSINAIALGMFCSAKDIKWKEIIIMVKRCLLFKVTGL